jgi:cytidylate kinase
MGEVRRRPRPLVAIDGPVGAGKSTVARALAGVLGFTYLNTGAMYRAVAIAAVERGIDLNDDPGLAARLAPILAGIAIGFDGERVLLDGRDVSGKIIAPAISELASRLSTLAVVRDRLHQAQREAGRDGGIVMEGRDIGTAIFPDAECKFFLTAEVEVRARRRFDELVAKGTDITFAAVLAQLRERDRRDQERELAPLRRAADAIEIDATLLNVNEVVAAMKARVDKCWRDEKDLKRT